MPTYQFQDIAINCTEKIKADDIDVSKYIGLEHLDSGSLSVKRWGSDVPIKGEKLVMHKGDVLFGKRNTYLRRAAIAPHDGAFSAHGMVLRPKENVVDKDFFPLFIASDYFFDAAIRISVGSLSPTVNWKDLKDLEFNIPSIPEQRKMSKVLWAINDSKESYADLIQNTDELIKSQFIKIFGDPRSNAKGWKKLKVKDAVEQGYIARPLDGNHGEKHPKNSDYVESGVPFLMAQDLKDKSVDFSHVHFITEQQAKTLTKGWAKPGDVLLTHKGTIGRVAIIQPSKYYDMLLTPQITYYRCLKEISNEFLAEFFLTDYFQEQLQKMITGATRASVTITQQENLELIIPPMELQLKYVELVKQADKSKSALQASIKELNAMYKRIIKDNLG